MENTAEQSLLATPSWCAATAASSISSGPTPKDDCSESQIGNGNAVVVTPVTVKWHDRPAESIEQAMIEECLKVTFEVKTDDCPLSDASKQAKTTIEARPPQLRSDGSTLLKFTARKDEQVRETLDEDDRIKFLHRAESDEYDVYRCLSTQPCVVHDLVDGGFLADSLEYHHGRAIFYGAIVDREVLKNVIDCPENTIDVKLRHLSPIAAEAREEVERLRNMTNRQEECLRVAARMGYFSIPREVTAEEVASELGISKSSFLERLRRAEREIFEEAFL